MYLFAMPSLPNYACERQIALLIVQICVSLLSVEALAARERARYSMNIRVSLVLSHGNYYSISILQI